MQCNGRHSMVFRNEKNGNVFWVLSDSCKDQEGNYVNQTFQVMFPRKVGTPNDRDIIKWSGFTTYKKVGKVTYTTIVINEWQLQSDYDTGKSSNQQSDNSFETENKQQGNDDDFFNSNISINNDDLPF